MQGECACGGISVIFFLRWIAKEIKPVKPGQMPLAGVNWGSLGATAERSLVDELGTARMGLLPALCLPEVGQPSLDLSIGV